MGEYASVRPIHPRCTLDEPVKLSITLMTANRKDLIRKCLGSMQHLRDAVPSEVIVVDTGCDEEMLSILREYAVEIVPFQWCNDFGAARNAGVAHCTGNWMLFIDDDEWFEDTTEIEEFFLSGEYRQYENAYYGIRNYSDKAGTEYADNEVLRMCRLTDETHFQGRIHELLLPSYENSKHLKSFVHHYGYAFDTEEEHIRHSYRNIEPMQAVVTQDPYDMYMKIHLAHGYFNTNENRSLAELCEVAVRQMQGVTDYQGWKIRSGFCSGYVCALCRMGFYEQALVCSDEFLSTSLTKMAQVTMYRWRAYAAYKAKRRDECLTAIRKYEEFMADFAVNPDSFFKDRIQMTEGSLHARKVIDAIKEAAQDDVFLETEKEKQKRQNYATMVELETSGKDDRQLAKLYYIEGELCRQKALCEKHMQETGAIDGFYRLGYVDAIFTQCRYERALQLIDEMLKNVCLSKEEEIMLYCEGCLSAFKVEDYTLAHAYGTAYQKAVVDYGQEVNRENIFLTAAIQQYNQNRIQEILNMLVPQSAQVVDEMNQLAEQIKEQARRMIEAGDMATAKSILVELQKMVPDDAEVARLLEK